MAQEIDDKVKSNGHLDVSPLDDTTPVSEESAEVVRAASLKLKQLQRDGIITRSDMTASMGVLQRLMNASTDEDYRQELKSSNLSYDEQTNFVAAISEAKRYGCSLTPIVDYLIARNAGEKGWRIGKILEGLTHTSFTTNYQGKNNGDKSKNSSSPLAR